MVHWNLSGYALCNICRKLWYAGTCQDTRYAIVSENCGTLELVRIRVMRYFQKIVVHWNLSGYALCDIFRKLGYTGTYQDMRYAIFSENCGTLELIRISVMQYFQKIGVQWNLSGYALCDILRKLGYTGTCQDTHYAIFSENWGTMELVRIRDIRYFQKICP